jgi:HD domain
MLSSNQFTPSNENGDSIIHVPNVVRFIEALIEGNPDSASAAGLLQRPTRDDARGLYQLFYPQIMAGLDIDLAAALSASEAKRKMAELLKVSALFHDIGKYIRRANHPQVGANLLRNYNDAETRKLVDLLIFPDERKDSQAKHNRFSWLSSIVHHHDKFGVVCTGEGGLPLFSDILYFASDEANLRGIRKNITSVMLNNLADIAAVNTAPSEQRTAAGKLAAQVAALRSSGDTARDGRESELLADLLDICRRRDACLGLGLRKMEQILTDWQILMSATERADVMGHRVRMKMRLLELERNPARAIQRVQRLLHESADTAGASALLTFITRSPSNPSWWAPSVRTAFKRSVSNSPSYRRWTTRWHSSSR